MTLVDAKLDAKTRVMLAKQLTSRPMDVHSGLSHASQTVLFARLMSFPDAFNGSRLKGLYVMKYVLASY